MHKDKKDSELIAEYYSMYEQRIFRIANAILGDVWQAEEAVQETFLKLIGRRDVVRRMSEKKRETYISKMAKNIAIDMYRKNKRDGEMVCMSLGTAESEDAYENRIWQSTGGFTNREMSDEVENRQILDSVLDKLPDDDALVLKLRAMRQLSVRETAAIMNMSETAVRKKYERAVNKAHKLLEKEMMLYE